MSTDKNSDGQPTDRRFNWRRIEDRLVDELIGLSKGVLADGMLVAEEAKYLHDWLESNREYANQWPLNVLYTRIKSMLIDGVLDEKEEEELVGLLLSLNGGPQKTMQMVDNSSQLPLDSPAPKIEFQGRQFCLTGKFLFGSRSKCEQAVYDKGGLVQGNPTQQTDYLVIGTLGSRDWIHTPFGRKIQKALEIKESGRGILIVSESHWTNHL